MFRDWYYKADNFAFMLLVLIKLLLPELENISSSKGEREREENLNHSRAEDLALK